MASIRVTGWDGLAQDAYFNMYGTMKQSLDQFPDLILHCKEKYMREQWRNSTAPL